MTSCVNPPCSVGVAVCPVSPASVVFAQAAAGLFHRTGAILNVRRNDHDASTADGVHLCPGACLAAEVKVGARSWIGIGLR